jgi:hypothetical protein
MLGSVSFSQGMKDKYISENGSSQAAALAFFDLGSITGTMEEDILSFAKQLNGAS